MRLSILVFLFSLNVAQAAPIQFRVNIVSSQGYAGPDSQKLERAVALFERVFNLPEFWNRLEKRDVPGCRSRGPGYDGTELTNAQVVDALLAAQENGSLQSDGIADLRLVMAPDARGEMGHTDMGPLGQITTGASTVREESDAGLAGHLAHEWTHTLGFGHPFLRRIWPSRRDRHICTVPYAVGNLVVEMVERVSGDE